ncbi:alcohol acetyltransferase [Propionibacteriaceae bacterium G1746]
MNERRAWVRLDNASNIFLASMSSVDTKVFRLSAQLDHDIDPELLQQALDVVFDQYVLYHSVLRRGVFWYYLEESDLRPQVMPETLPPCAHLYRFDRRDLLFRVLYHGPRLSLEVLHVLTDGTGASWVLQDLVAEYLRLKFPDEARRAAEPPGVKQGLVPDSFTQFHPRLPQQFAEAAQPAPLGASDQVEDAIGGGRPPGLARELFGSRKRRVHRVHGTLTPDHRNRVVELTMPVSQVLPIAREHGVSLTVLLTALFLHAVREVDGDAAKGHTMAISVPVDLRQRFASESGRNFFATTRLEFNEDEADFAQMCTALAGQLKLQTTPAALESKLRKFIGFEHLWVARVLPRPVKDVILGVANWLNSRQLTVAMTNVGRLDFAEDINQHVQAVFIAVSTPHPQFSMISHGDVLTVSFTSAFVETAHQAAFVRGLTGRGVDVRVAASKVNEDELAASGASSGGRP